MPKTREQIFDLFAEKAGNMGCEIHTPEGPKPMYSIYGSGRLIYATCTRALFEQYLLTWFLAPDGLYYANEMQYESKDFTDERLILN